MSSAVRPLIAGNWKMNGVTASLAEVRAIALSLTERPCVADVALCPPATLIAAAAQIAAGSPVAIGGQNCHAQPHGAFTGEISAEMLADAGASFVILGHSERRASNGETNAIVAAKAAAAVRAGLKPILCVGETFNQHQSGETLAIIESQINGSSPPSLADSAFAVAYEPCWAIGSGQTPTLAQIAEAHAAIRLVMVWRFGERGRLAPILYGGSVKADNVREILSAPEVDGALVGGASLTADDFLGIVRAL